MANRVWLQVLALSSAKRGYFKKNEIASLFIHSITFTIILERNILHLFFHNIAQKPVIFIIFATIKISINEGYE
ncbi:hypothetical protein D1Z97_07990 [Riemerella anatipestifer]|nr:hypothetical protein [Riemerella anatipestifer]MRN01122.1 hypothetical protein [Riemerella anatipestifer]MRN01760.1 hypothetical protein [Riemerella anatipestifer]